MSTNVQKAASRLLAQLDAPRGAVNTLAHFDTQGPLIRVLVDPAYWYRLSGVIPVQFEGFRVVGEKRQQSVAQH